MVWLLCGVDSGDVVWTVEMLGSLVVVRCGQWRF